MLFVFVVLPALWSCGEDDEEVTDPGEGAPRTFAEAEATFSSLRETLIDLTTSEGLTRTSEFPSSGIVTFKGVHSGDFFENNTTSESKLSYVADVVLTLDFETEKFTGQLLNFTTNLAGFENPGGELNISGSIRGPDDLGGDEYGLRFMVQDGDLTQGERTATFDARTANKGRFYGNSAQFIALKVSSTFRWTEGPDTGTTSGTSGFMYAESE